MSRIADFIIHRITRRAPDFVVGGPDNPYLRRWWIIPRNPVFNIYLHQFLRDDDDRALHDHPWAWCSILLRGAYAEITSPKFHLDRDAGFITFRGKLPKSATVKAVYEIGSRDVRVSMCQIFEAGSMRFHRPKFAHRLELLTDRECWTLFLTGPRVRNWGFHCPKGWVPWQRFTATGDRGAIGAGCGEMRDDA